MKKITLTSLLIFMFCSIAFSSELGERARQKLIAAKNCYESVPYPYQDSVYNMWREGALMWDNGNKNAYAADAFYTNSIGVSDTVLNTGQSVGGTNCSN
jgi:hypothetical protein